MGLCLSHWQTGKVQSIANIKNESCIHARLEQPKVFCEKQEPQLSEVCHLQSFDPEKSIRTRETEENGHGTPVLSPLQIISEADRLWMSRPVSSVWDHYEPLTLLGTGSFSTVKLARRKTTGELFAVKVIRKKKGMENANSSRDVQREIQARR